MFLLIFGVLFGNNFKKKSYCLILISLLGVCFLFTIYSLSCPKELLIRHAKAQQSLQTLINNASPGSILYVSSGTYVERIVINKPLTIIGENPDNTVIDGEGTDVLVDITSDDVTLINFTLRNNGGYGIRIVGLKKIVIKNNFVESNNQGISIKFAQDINITENKFAKNYQGVEVFNSSGITISGNFFNESYGPGLLCYVSSGVTIHSNVIINNYAYATYFESIDNFVLYNNTVRGGCEGVHLLNCIHGAVTKNTILGTGPYGLTLERSSEVLVNECEFDSNEYAFQIINSQNNTISENTLVNNKFGMILICSSHNNLIGNVMYENWWSFGVYGEQLEHYINYVDPSNTVNSKPIYYIINCAQFEISGEAGCVVIVNSSNAFVRNAKIENSYQGVVLAYSESITLIGLNIYKNFIGVSFYNSINSVVTECNITMNIFGLWFNGSSFNRIYLNNFVKNENFMSINSCDFFDNGHTVGGNYWDSYVGSDCDYDGIGDVPYKISLENTDNFPYMGLIYKFNVSEQCDILASTNSTIENFEYFNNGTLRFYLLPIDNQHFGFFRVRIPKALFYANISVLVDDVENTVFTNLSIYDDCTYRWIYFYYSGSSHKIEIVPAFSFIYIISFFISSLMFTYLTKMRDFLK